MAVLLKQKVCVEMFSLYLSLMVSMMFSSKIAGMS